MEVKHFKKHPYSVPVGMKNGRDSNPRYAKRTTVFETAPIDHSGTFPVKLAGLFPKAGAKIG